MTQPASPSVNASPAPSRTPTHDSRSPWIATPSMQDVSMSLLQAGLSRRSPVALPLQGHGQLLVPGHGHRSPPGLRLDLPVPAAGKPEDRRARLLLQREGRLLPRGRPPAAAADEIQLTGGPERSRTDHRADRLVTSSGCDDREDRSGVRVRLLSPGSRPP